jgi:hypothetical protein
MALRSEEGEGAAIASSILQFAIQPEFEEALMINRELAVLVEGEEAIRIHDEMSLLCDQIPQYMDKNEFPPHELTHAIFEKHGAYLEAVKRYWDSLPLEALMLAWEIDVEAPEPEENARTLAEIIRGWRNRENN